MPSSFKKWKRRREINREIEAMWSSSFDGLAYYNRDKSRGIQHTPEMAERMAAIQERYDREYLPRLYQLLGERDD